MDRAMLSSSDEEDPPTKALNTECEMEDSDVFDQELLALNQTETPFAEFAPKVKHILGKRKLCSDKQLEVELGENLCEREIQVTSKHNREKYTKGILHRYAVKSNYSSVRKTNNIRNMALKYLKRAKQYRTSTLKNIRFIRTKGKILKFFNSNSSEMSAKNEECISEMSKYKGIFEEDFWLEMMSQTKVDSVEDLTSIVTNTGKTKSEGSTLSNFETSDEDAFDQELINLPSCSTQSTSASLTQIDVSKTHASEDIPGKKVLEHFRRFLQSEEETLDRTNTEDINREDIKPSPDSEMRSLKCSNKEETECIDQDLEDSE